MCQDIKTVEKNTVVPEVSETKTKGCKMVGEGVGFERIRRITGGPTSLASK